MTVCMYRDIHTLQPYIIDLTQRGCHTLSCHLLCFISCLYSKPIVLRNDRMTSVQDFELSWSPILNTVISGYRDWFQQIRKRLHGQQVSSLPFLLCGSLSAESSCLALSKVDCFHASRNETVLQSFGLFYAFKN